MTKKKLAIIRHQARKNFDGSEALFEACWRRYMLYVRTAVDASEDDVDDWLESIASEKVNDPKSRFYIYG